MMIYDDDNVDVDDGKKMMAHNQKILKTIILRLKIMTVILMVRAHLSKNLERPMLRKRLMRMMWREPKKKKKRRKREKTKKLTS